jgi:RNA polymerase sigma factor (sigma-70 family)
VDNVGVGQALNPAARAPQARGSKRLLSLRGDAHLAARVRAGDDVAFEVLYDRYAAVLLSFCRHMLGRQEEAEDAVQQVFVSAHAALLRAERPTHLKAWLYAIARNRCLSVLRARREHPGPEVAPATAGLDEQVQDRADLRELLADLADLPEHQRAALLLTELDDLSHAEAASVLDCEAAQVKGMVFRARAGLIERRDARVAPCAEIREELATARKGALRRGRLRHHLKHCAGCSAYLEEVRRQRRLMALILPVVPATGLKRAVLAAVGVGSGAGGAGGLTLAGGSALTATVAKVAVVGALAGGAGLAGHEALDRGHAPAPAKSAAPAPTAAAARPAKRATSRPAAAVTRPSAKRPAASRAHPIKAGRAADQGAEPKTATPGSRSRSNRGATPPGLAKRPAAIHPAKPHVKKPVTPRGLAHRPAKAKGTPATPAHGNPARPPQAGPKHGPAKNGQAHGLE